MKIPSPDRSEFPQAAPPCEGGPPSHHHIRPGSVEEPRAATFLSADAGGGERTYSNSPCEGPRVRFKVDVQPDESLPSILVRSAHKHGLWLTVPILNRAGMTNTRPGRVYCADPRDLRRLAWALRQSESDLAARAGEPNSSGCRFGDLFIPRGLIDVHQRWIGPRSLDNSPHHRFSWNIRLLPYCPVSGERLVGTCPACGHKLGWHHTRGIETCEACLLPVPASTEEPLSEDLLDGYRRMARLLSFDPIVRRQAHMETDEDLHCFTPGKVAFGALALAQILTGGGLRKRDLRQVLDLPAVELGQIVGRTGSLVLDWQIGARVMLRQAADQLADDPHAFHRLWRGLKSLVDPRQSDLATCDMTLCALPNVASSVWTALKSDQRTYQTQQVVLTLGVRNKVVRMLADKKALRTERCPSGHRRNILFDADEVDELRGRMEKTMALSSVAAELGLPYYGAEQLAALGMVEYDPNPALWIIYGKARVDTRSFERLLGHLRQGITIQEPPRGTVSVREAAKLFGGREKPWGALIEAICAGVLPCYKAASDPSIPALFVDAADLRSLRLRPFDRDSYTFPFSDVISQNDAEDLLNITPRMLAEFGLAKVLGFRKGKKGNYAPIATIAAFAGEVVPRSELALRWGVKIHDVDSDHRLRGIERVSFGWSRGQLLQSGFI